MARTNDPRRLGAELTRAANALGLGHIDRAEGLFRAIVRRHPRVADAHYALARIALLKNDAREGIERARAAIAIDPSNGAYHFALARLLRDDGRMREALDAYARAALLEPRNADAHAESAAILERLSRFDEARASIERALAADPRHEMARVFGARIAFRAAAEPDAEALEAWARTLRPIATHANQRLARSIAWSVLADIHDARGEVDEAFDAIGASNALEREIQHAPSDDDRARYLAAIDAIAPAMSRERAERWRAEAPDDGLPDPALLVGFPRSGTTMTERALSAHPRVRAIEERPTFERTRDEMVRMMGARARELSVAEMADALTPAQVGRLREFYWECVREELGGEAIADGTLVLDKLPLRILLLPLVNRLFPDARVLVALRDPRDVCLSCLRQRFAMNVPMSFFLDLQDTARLYAHTMRAWLETRGAYSLPWLEVRYEDTVSDFPTRMREILAFLGLAWDDAVLSFHERAADRPSTTPSYHAIRAGVSTRAVGRWRAYEGCLAPILPALEPFVGAFGYE